MADSGAGDSGSFKEITSRDDIIRLNMEAYLSLICDCVKPMFLLNLHCYSKSMNCYSLLLQTILF